MRDRGPSTNELSTPACEAPAADNAWESGANVRVPESQSALDHAAALYS
jgi:hypothetical protein